VVTWRHHPPRARLVFRQCLSDASGSVITRTVPHSYHYSAALGGELEVIFAYQYTASLKAMLLTDCK
jgi:hypothetical protein